VTFVVRRNSSDQRIQIAEELLDKSVKKNDQEAIFSLSTRLVGLFIEAGRHQDAIDHLLRLIQKMGGEQNTTFLQGVNFAFLGSTYMDLGKSDEAKKALHIALKSLSGSTRPPFFAFELYCNYLLGIIEYQNNNRGKSVEYMDKAIRVAQRIGEEDFRRNLPEFKRLFNIVLEEKQKYT